MCTLLSPPLHTHLLHSLLQASQARHPGTQPINLLCALLYLAFSQSARTHLGQSIHVTLLCTENYMDPVLGTQNQVMGMGNCYVQLLAKAILCSSRGAVQFTAVSHGNRSRKHIIRENIFRLTSHSH